MYSFSKYLLSTYCELANVLSDKQNSYISLMIKILVGKINNKQVVRNALKKKSRYKIYLGRVVREGLFEKAMLSWVLKNEREKNEKNRPAKWEPDLQKSPRLSLGYSGVSARVLQNQNE